MPALRTGYRLLRNERRRGRDFGPDHVAVGEQPVAIGGHQIGQQHQTVAFREQREQLADDGRHLGK